jgi:chemotaxis protein histidine kinase CheA
LEVQRERDSLIIVIGDDGRGIDRSAITRHLMERGSMTDEQIAGMSEEEFLSTILSPEFSSESEITDMSGRGIGMSVVAQAIEYLGGSMTIRSEPSKGTVFTIRLPLSLSVIHAVTFGIGTYTLSIPTSNVESVGRREHASPEDSDSSYDLRGLLGVNGGGEVFYTLKLRHLAAKSSTNKRDGDVELVVDRILGNRPLVVMPVGELLAKARLFAGVGIMENGDISMLLDLEHFPEV